MVKEGLEDVFNSVSVNFFFFLKVIGIRKISCLLYQIEDFIKNGSSWIEMFTRLKALPLGGKE